jgi:hypothetical protein
MNDYDLANANGDHRTVEEDNALMAEEWAAGMSASEDDSDGKVLLFI